MTERQRAPRVLRLTLLGAAALLLAGAVYLIAVRGNALMADLAALGSRVWCF